MIDDAQLADVRGLVAATPLLGVELDLTYRVLALTIEPTGDRGFLGAQDDDEDRRLQVLLHPVAEVAASFQEIDEDGHVTVLTFGTDQLPDIVAVLGEPTIGDEPFPAERPSREGWVRPSMQGSSGATDGRSRHLHVDVSGEGFRLRLHATFDDVEIRDPSGEQVWATDAAPHVPGGPMGPGGRNLPLL